MALEDVIARFCNVTENADVTLESAPVLGATPVTCVTPVSDEAAAKTDSEPPSSLRWLWAQGCTDATRKEVEHLMQYLPLDRADRARALRAYVLLWLEVAEATPLLQQQQGAGRKAANTAIREGNL
jgi:hypothetical protein